MFYHTNALFHDILVTLQLDKTKVIWRKNRNKQESFIKWNV